MFTRRSLSRFEIERTTELFIIVIGVQDTFWHTLSHLRVHFENIDPIGA
jgi:hypothetical protein